MEQHQEHLESFDLRQINGLCCADDALPPCASLEEFASSAACKGIRIISYKDFLKVISQALPRFLAGEPISLRQASWQGERTYWNSTARNLPAPSPMHACAAWKSTCQRS